MKTVAIIGANGMLGSDLALHLKSSFSVTGITKENYASYSNKEFDIVINANGNSKRFWANKNILEDFTLSTVSVYRSIFDFPTKQYIYISSSDVYQNHHSPRYTKENSEIKPEQLSSYGLHKYLSEQIVKKHVPKFLILRSSMILGQGLKKGPIFDILHEKELFISKDSCVQMITTKAVAALLQALIDRNISGKILNMGGKGAVSTKKMENITHKKLLFSVDTEKQNYEMNISQLDDFYSLKKSEEYLSEFLSGYNEK